MTNNYITSQELLDKNQLTEREILNLKKRLAGYTKNKDLKESELNFKEEYLITPEQTQKGLDWLTNKAFKPSKMANFKPEWKERNIQEAMRETGEFGTREAYIIVNFDHFTFTGFYHDCNSYGESMGLHNLASVWRVYDNEGDSFDYYVSGGKAVIIG